MKTQVMTFRISNSFEEWSKHFDSHLKIQKAAGMTPLFRGPHEDDPQKVCIVIQISCIVQLCAMQPDGQFPGQTLTFD